ncbi:MAG: OadG family protein [Euryarchaeota archaeon]|nr:OadG family protein [Euryarchaeota archaeon]
MKNAVVPIIIFVFVSSLASGTSPYLPPYTDWQFSYEASNATFAPEKAEIYVNNGYANLSASLLKSIDEGMHFTLNLSAEVSPAAIETGVILILNGHQVLKQKLDSGKNTLSFFATENYPKGTDITLIVYCYGANVHLTLSPAVIQKPRGGIDEGLLLTGVGITVVFTVLSILAGVMYTLKIITSKKEKEAKKLAVKNVDKSEISPEVLAAITAALEAYMHGKKFKIISVKPSVWKLYGRMNMMRRGK